MKFFEIVYYLYVKLKLIINNMKMTKTEFKQLIKEAIQENPELVLNEGFMDKMKDAFNFGKGAGSKVAGDVAKQFAKGKEKAKEFAGDALAAGKEANEKFMSMASDALSDLKKKAQKYSSEVKDKGKMRTIQGRIEGLQKELADGKAKSSEYMKMANQQRGLNNKIGKEIEKLNKELDSMVSKETKNQVNESLIRERMLIFA